MKHIFLFSLSLLLLTNLSAQKKAATNAAKPTAQKETPKTITAAPPSTSVPGSPEEFKKLAGTARQQYDAGKLDDSRFALQQMLYELDMIIGKEVLKALPASMTDKQAVGKLDNVSGASGFFGVVIHREYGIDNTTATNDASRNISLEIISNSPLISSVNSLLSIPLIGGGGDNKVVKIAGYKALVSKVQGDNDQTDYDLQMPIGNSMITLKAPGYTQDQVVQMANSLPIQQIATMLQ